MVVNKRKFSQLQRALQSASDASRQLEAICSELAAPLPGNSAEAPNAPRPEAGDILQRLQATATSIGLQRSIMRLSSGYRINNAGDDAAGLAVANTYRSTQAVLNQGIELVMRSGACEQVREQARAMVAPAWEAFSLYAPPSSSKTELRFLWESLMDPSMEDREPLES